MDLVVISSCLIAFFVYFNTLEADFAYDDSRAIKTNPDVLPTTPLFQILSHDFWGTPLTHSGSHKSYRPITVLSFRLNYLLGEFDPYIYHLTNILLHSTATGLFAAVSNTVIPRAKWARTLAPLLFAVHPVHTEAVAGIVGRADVGASIFFLSSLLAYIRYCNDYKMARKSFKCFWLFLSLLFASIAMLTKEYGVTVLAVCAFYHVFIYAKLNVLNLCSILTERRHRDVRVGLSSLGVTLLVLLTCRLYVMGSNPPEFAPADNPAADCDNAVARTLTFFFLPVFNTWLLLCPAKLSFDWSMEAIPLVKSFLDHRNALSLIFYSGLGALSYLVFFKRTLFPRIYQRQFVMFSITESCRKESSEGQFETVSFALAFLVFPFLPATNIFFYVGFVVAERILYIPSMGSCLLVAWGVQILHNRTQSHRLRKLYLVTLFAILACFSIRTWRRNRDWLTEENLYKSGISVNPPKAYGNLANILSAKGDKVRAEWAYRKALSYRSNMADVHYNLGILLQEQKRLDAALQEYKLAIQFRPRMAMAHLNMGLVLGLLGRTDEAAEMYRKCAQLDSSGLKDPRTHEVTKISALFNLGRLYADEGSYDQAITVYKEAVHKMPQYYLPQSLYNMLGEAFFKQEKYSEAEKWYLKALKAKPNHVPAHLTYGKLLAKMERLEEAEDWFLMAMKLAPNDSSVHQHFGQFLSECDRHEEAAEHYLQAANLSPSEYEIIFNAANTLRQAGRNGEAELFYREAVKMRPMESTSHLNLGAMLHVNGKFQEAEASYLEALRLKPDDIVTSGNLKKLRQMYNKSDTFKKR